jgi:hypothetical protein
MELNELKGTEKEMVLCLISKHSSVFTLRGPRKPKKHKQITVRDLVFGIIIIIIIINIIIIVNIIGCQTVWLEYLKGCPRTNPFCCYKRIKEKLFLCLTN